MKTQFQRHSTQGNLVRTASGTDCQPLKLQIAFAHIAPKLLNLAKQLALFCKELAS